MNVAPRSRLRFAITSFVALAAGALIIGFTGTDEDGRPKSTFSIEETRSFTEVPVYYAGDSADGVPLVAVRRRKDSANHVAFIYGECDARDHVGCAPPGEVQIWPACVRNPARYAGNRSPVSPVGISTIARGVPAALFEEGHRLEIQTGTATVVIFGHTPTFVAVLTKALRGTNNPVGREVDLPAPAPGAIEGGLGCDA